jgi:hypothetical protein
MLFYSRIQAKKPSRGSTDQGHGAFALLSNSAHSVFEVVDYYSDIVADGHKLSPAVDAGLQIGCRLGRMIEVHAGYDLLWLNSVAQASRQVAGTTSYNSEPTLTLVYSSLIAHGAKAGVTIRF